MADNFFTRFVDHQLDRHVDRRAIELKEKFGKTPDGKPDPELAARIDHEVHRRGAAGKQLDIYEPIRWTGVQFLLSAALAIGTKLVTAEKKVTRKIMATTALATALSTSIQLFRIPGRYDAGLDGGVNIAQSMHEFDKKARAEGTPATGYWVSQVTQPAHESPQRGARI